ncbi:unnamed protein product [Moneuplotes crassus]|uniref:Uncharacterized protein n=1 Tax=Euplotes crassus TaxID=5936 RepID=A0AAD1XGM4_EUPCR|nr:unnamed protein product [Moneuplotes crassus]
MSLNSEPPRPGSVCKVQPPLEAGSNFELEMLKKDLAFQKDCFEKKLQRKEEKIIELQQEIECQKKIRARIKTELAMKINTADQFKEEKLKVSQTLKEAENKNENLKLMLASTKLVMDKLLVLFSDLKMYMKELKDDEQEVLECVKERYQKKSIEQNFILISSNCEGDASGETKSLKSAPADISVQSKEVIEGSDLIISKDFANPDSLFYDFLEGNQMKHLDSLDEVIKDINVSTEIVQKEVEKISKLDQKKLVEAPPAVNFDDILFKNSSNLQEKERAYQNNMCKLISQEIAKVSKTMSILKQLILEGKFTELKQMLLDHEDKKGRRSEAFTPNCECITEKENIGTYTHVKDEKKYRLLSHSRLSLNSMKEQSI